MGQSTASGNTYTVKYMREKLGLFQKNMKFTILTSARLITNHLILKLYHMLSIEQDIGSKVQSVEKHSGQETTTNHPASHTEQPTVKSVVKSSPWRLKLSMGLNFVLRSVSRGVIQLPIYAINSVLYALNGSARGSQIKSAVQKSVAEKTLDQIVELNQWNISTSAHGVEMSSLQTELTVRAAQKSVRLNMETGVDMLNLDKALAVRIQEVTEVGLQPVYNFEVDEYHNYLVEGGMVSHNSHDDHLDAMAQLIQLDLYSNNSHEPLYSYEELDNHEPEYGGSVFYD